MDGNTSPQVKSQRRKRKDPESRDFICICGKKYLSYAAAYTHVKNKHYGEKDYLQQIGRPQRTKLKRGRPKERKHYEITLQNEKLSIVQEAILCIYQSFKAREQEQQFSSKLILQGNQQFSVKSYQICYSELVESFGLPNFSLSAPAKINSQPIQLINQFVKILNQHFLPHIAAKVMYYMNTIMKKGSNIEEAGKVNAFQIYFSEIRYKINKQAIMNDLWSGNKEIPNFIVDALEKWMYAGERSHGQIQERFINF